jgi:hypothetical protein
VKLADPSATAGDVYSDLQRADVGVSETGFERGLDLINIELSNDHHCVPPLFTHFSPISFASSTVE